MKQDYEKMRVAMRYWLLGKGYHKAITAMEYAEKFHTGTRKDGNPEFSHQISIASYARTLTSSMSSEDEENLLCAIFLHDLVEDYPVTLDDVSKKCGEEVSIIVDLLTKENNGVKKDNPSYYGDLPMSALASLAKGFDRVHNLMTMLGGFKPEKRVEYIGETIEFVVPMLKEARRRYSKYEFIYENIKFVITNQVQLYNELDKEHA